MENGSLSKSLKLSSLNDGSDETNKTSLYNNPVTEYRRLIEESKLQFTNMKVL